MNFGMLPEDVQREIYLYLDATSLARFEGTHKCFHTQLAWHQLACTRFQLTMSNRPHLDWTADPRSLFRRLLQLGGPAGLTHFRQNDKALLRQAHLNLRQLKRMAPRPCTQPAMGLVLDVFCTTTPSCDGLWDEAPNPASTASTASFEECLYEQWLMLRELAQRGIVQHEAMLKKLNAGDTVLHIGRLHTGMSGMSTLQREGGVFQVKESRVNAVFNGIVQYQELDPDPAAQFMTQRIGWAARSDMFVLEIS